MADIPVELVHFDLPERVPWCSTGWEEAWIMVADMRSWNLLCLECGVPLRGLDEGLNEFMFRLYMEEMYKLGVGFEFNSMAYFCSTQCAADFHGYRGDAI